MGNRATSVGHSSSQSAPTTQLYVSVISHHHGEIIEKLGSLKRLAQHPNITVLLRNNVDPHSAASVALSQHCLQHGIDYIVNKKAQGFGANNNANFLYAQGLGMQADDVFVIFNPDVHINGQTIRQLVQCITQRDQLSALTNQQSDLADQTAKGDIRPCPHTPTPLNLATINLFLNSKRTRFDDNLRRYPNLLNFARNYLLRDRSTVIDKSQPIGEGTRFWASGALLLCRAKLYQALGGFDERYHMYCEDIDFCLRAERLGYPVEFLPKLSAIHYRRCHSQRFLSKAFRQHVCSVFKFSLAKYCLARPKSRIVSPSMISPSEQASSKQGQSHRSVQRQEPPSANQVKRANAPQKAPAHRETQADPNETQAGHTGRENHTRHQATASVFTGQGSIRRLRPAPQCLPRTGKMAAEKMSGKSARISSPKSALPMSTGPVSAHSFEAYRFATKAAQKSANTTRNGR